MSPSSSLPRLAITISAIAELLVIIIAVDSIVDRVLTADCVFSSISVLFYRLLVTQHCVICNLHFVTFEADCDTFQKSNHL